MVDIAMDSHDASATPNESSSRCDEPIKEVVSKHRTPRYTDDQRLQALALFDAGMPAAAAAARSGIRSGRTVIGIAKKAVARGYDPRVTTVLKLEYVRDGPRAGRPRKSDRKNTNDKANDSVEDSCRDEDNAQSDPRTRSNTSIDNAS